MRYEASDKRVMDRMVAAMAHGYDPAMTEIREIEKRERELAAEAEDAAYRELEARYRYTHPARPEVFVPADWPGEVKVVDLIHPGEGRHRADEFVTKDSGERVDYPSGMRRDVDTGKPRYDLIPRFMLRRLADLYARGAEKYGEDNYTLADSELEWRRFQASAFRHFIQWINGERDEDHGAAVFFNITAAEMVAGKLGSDAGGNAESTSRP